MEIERDSAPYHTAIVRPGLVYDSAAPQGVVGALARLIDLSPIVPLVARGKLVLSPCDRDDLTTLIYALCMRDMIPTSVPIIASSAHGMTFREILAAMARHKGKSPQFVPIPAFPLLITLRVAEGLGVRSRLRSDTLVSLMNQPSAVDFCALATLGVLFRGLELGRAVALRLASKSSI